MIQIDLALPSDRRAAGRARAELDRLGQEVGRHLLEDVRLLVSELVTNSLRHAGLGPRDSIRLRVTATRETVRVEVTDGGPGFRPGQPAPNLYHTSGWGLYLVDQLSDRWSVDVGEATMVWFEIDTVPTRARPAPDRVRAGRS